jgi:hypothetical protein
MGYGPGKRREQRMERGKGRGKRRGRGRQWRKGRGREMVMEKNCYTNPRGRGYHSCCCFAVAEGNVRGSLGHRGLTGAGIYTAESIAHRVNFVK